MTITDLVNAVEVVTDDQGNKKAVLDWEVWQEILALLEEEGGARETMLLTEQVLRRDWDTPEEDEAWAHL